MALGDKSKSMGMEEEVVVIGFADECDSCGRTRREWKDDTGGADGRRSGEKGY